MPGEGKQGFALARRAQPLPRQIGQQSGPAMSADGLEFNPQRRPEPCAHIEVKHHGVSVSGRERDETLQRAAGREADPRRDARQFGQGQGDAETDPAPISWKHDPHERQP
ncbi:hypothetical protein DS843_21620 [Roseomonas genomospecies 6]|uniref:Uncharacterized protein n=1 Tax=Roseomonas genomospecies 6 TaxID=214106 RepID=A0A9W7KR89_9PROT|nr:hypothetical protein DS843_21620 [Roseomonas genomospecies 6]